MLSLFIPLLERVGLIILVANLLMGSRFYKDIFYRRNELNAMLVLTLTFGIFALISNLTGVVVNQENIINTGLLFAIQPGQVIANTRSLSIGIAGIVGGPIVGLAVGLISGAFRMIQGGVAPHTYLISSILIGLISGMVGQREFNRNTFITVKKGILLGVFLEAVQVLCIFIFYPDHLAVWRVLSVIALPMLVLNAFGTGIFLSIIRSTLRQEENMKAVQTHDVLELANKTLPYFRQGLNEESCRQAAQQIQFYMKVAAVAITDQSRILAHIGAGDDHHVPKKEIVTDLTKEVIASGKMNIVREKEAIGCTHEDCPLVAAVIIPLHIKEQVVGSIKLYFVDSNKLTHVEEQLIAGLAEIFSSQLELGEMENQQKLLKDMEIKALQAQVNPHFFFNAINTISALIRIDSEKARTLLLELGNYFRFNLQGVRNELILLDDEFRHLAAYLTIEQTRFPGRYSIHYDLDPEMSSAYVPPFLIQILVENAIKHGFSQRKENNIVNISAKKQEEKLRIVVEDNGSGIDPQRLALLGKVAVDSEKGTGTALENLNRRLLGLFGQRATMTIESSEKGSKFVIELPFIEEI